MARRFSSNAVISFFGGEDSEGVAEAIFDGSDDELGMNNEEEVDSEPDFEPFEPFHEGKQLYTT